jgi:hypothetical protein
MHAEIEGGTKGLFPIFVLIVFSLLTPIHEETPSPVLQTLTARATRTLP